MAASDDSGGGHSATVISIVVVVAVALCGTALAVVCCWPAYKKRRAAVKVARYRAGNTGGVSAQVAARLQSNSGADTYINPVYPMVAPSGFYEEPVSSYIAPHEAPQMDAQSSTPVTLDSNAYVDVRSNSESTGSAGLRGVKVRPVLDDRAYVEHNVQSEKYGATTDNARSFYHTFLGGPPSDINVTARTTDATA